MVNANQVAEIGMLVGEPARAAILAALMDGRALTASELARVAGITPQTASSHLARLVAADLLKVKKQGRHRYHALASPDVARMLEGIMQIASANAGKLNRKIVVGPRDQALRRARTCYDHFAGGLGVAIADGLIRQGMIELDDDGGLVTDVGLEALRRHGIDVEGDGSSGSKSVRLRSSRPRPSRPRPRPLCRPCLDWSERRPHVAGKLGAVICTHYLEAGYVRRIKGSRAVDITPMGRTALRDMFGVAGVG